ncbi:hypothetical protein ON010_g9564 [Phytophthora cinnamomi]|nr:hypothetical protein ON010_g9564 [Phytophthora cinnamomi]
MNSSDSESDGEQLMLSGAALAALQEFAIERGIAVEEGSGMSPPADVRPGHMTLAPDSTNGIAPLSARTCFITCGTAGDTSTATVSAQNPNVSTIRMHSRADAALLRGLDLAAGAHVLLHAEALEHGDGLAADRRLGFRAREMATSGYTSNVWCDLASFSSRSERFSSARMISSCLGNSSSASAGTSFSSGGTGSGDNDAGSDTGMSSCGLTGSGSGGGGVETTISSTTIVVSACCGAAAPCCCPATAGADARRGAREGAGAVGAPGGPGAAAALQSRRRAGDARGAEEGGGGGAEAGEAAGGDAEGAACVCGEGKGELEAAQPEAAGGDAPAAMTQDEEIKKLQAQLQAAKVREEKMAAALAAAKREVDKGKQRKGELKILYAKFSSTMDSVSEKTMRLEELEQEINDAKTKASDMEAQNEELAKQVAQLQQQMSDLSAAQHREKDDMNEELSKVQDRCAELRELKSRQKQLASEMQAEIEELKAQNDALREQQVKMEHQSVGQPSNEGDKRTRDGVNALVKQIAEKEALQMFVQHYYSAAEAKCSELLEQVSELESSKVSIQRQTKESCSVLRMCTQIESCDESIRASLLDVMATLEGLA